MASVYFGPWVAAAYSAHLTNIQGGSTGDIIKAGAIAGAAAYASGSIGASDMSLPAQILAQGVLGGAVSAASGGKFRDGFYAAAATTAFSPAIDGIKGNTATARVARVAVAATIGGTASELSGGKFGNGAYTAAFLQSVTEASKYYEETVGWQADATPGDHYYIGKEGNCCKYREGPNGETPGPDAIVIGHNRYYELDSANWGIQGGYLGHNLNMTPLANATAHLHDRWSNVWVGKGVPFNNLTNYGTMVPAAAISLGAAIGNFTRGWQSNQVIWSSVRGSNYD